MSCTGTSRCICGCCAGTSVETPQVSTNRAGLSSVSYRVGNWASFRDSMLARLSSSDYPALGALKTRDDDDFTIAFLDATAMVLDILTFYQERLVNESYLRTAGQLRSLIELSRLIGYQPSPGVAASCYVAFTLKTAPGQTPNPSAPAITIPQGTQMQSVPAQGAKPQTFETSADIPAKPDWNALPVQTGEPWSPQTGDLGVYLQGTATQLQPGDLILIVGEERTTTNHDSKNWDIRELTTVRPDGLNGITYVEWSEPLGSGSVHPAQQHPRFFAFRQRGALFGYNAVNPALLSKDTLTGLNTAGLITGNYNTTPPPEWKFAAPGTQLIDLDSQYTKLATGGWIALVHPDKNTSRKPAGFISLYQIVSLTTMSRSDYGASAKITRAAVDTSTRLSDYYTQFTRETSALLQSEQLAVPPQPLLYPLYGSSIALEDLRPDLSETIVIAISGKRQKVMVKAAGTATFSSDDGSDTNVALDAGSVLTLTAPGPLLGLDPSRWKSGSGSLALDVEDSAGRPGTLKVDLKDLALAASGKNDPVVSECALVTRLDSTSGAGAHTVITLKSPLENCYERNTASVNANVVMATNGRSVSEVMGNGNASVPNQSFTLKQSPLTYTQAQTPTGSQSTLVVRVSGVQWKQVPTLYEQKPSAQVFTTQYQSDSTTDVLFGDGVEGSTLPTGQNNLQTNYRIGTGFGGNIASGTLTTLVDRPLGVSGVTNPEPATGGQDPQTVDDIRSSSPQTVLTLGRAVSIVDYQSFASTFAGISKAYAIWIPSGPGRGVFLTVAGVNGEELTQSSITLTNLVAALKRYGNPLIPVTAQSFLETLFGLSADVKYDPNYDQPTVEAEVRAALSTTYSFANRSFGQGVSVDEVASVIQAVAGVVAVNVKELHWVATSAAGDLAFGGAFSIPRLNAWLARKQTLPRPFDTQARICPYLPVPSLTELPRPAELLVLDPDPAEVKLGVMA